MNGSDIAVIVIVSVAVLAVAAALIYRRIRHKGCCGGCKGCPHCGKRKTEK